MTAELVVALTIWFEARSEGPGGMDRVASVLANRARRTGNSVEFLCLVPKHFSCWREGRDGSIRPVQRERPRAGDAEFAYSLRLARRLRAGTFKPVSRATHYHTVDVNPWWNRDMILLERYKNTAYYKERRR